MRRTVSSNCPCTRRRNPLSWRSNRGTPSLATSSLPRRPSRNPSRPVTAHPLEETRESGYSTAPKGRRWNRCQRGRLRDREPPRSQFVAACKKCFSLGECAMDPRDAAPEGGPDRRDDQESGDRYRDLRVGEAEEPEVQGPVDRHHVQRDTEEDLEADQEGDPFAASDDPQALT